MPTNDATALLNNALTFRRAVRARLSRAGAGRTYLVRSRAGVQKLDTPCELCRETGIRPSHDGSRNCESGSIASGGDVAHCTCDVCF